jgi:hypothetical protein
MGDLRDGGMIACLNVYMYITIGKNRNLNIPALKVVCRPVLLITRTQ